MVWTANATRTFFENADSMGVPADTRVKLIDEGLATVDDLAEFKEDTLKDVQYNLRYHNDMIPDPNPPAGLPDGAPVPQIRRGPYLLPAKSKKRMLEAGELVRFYRTVGRDTSAANMTYAVISFFTQAWEVSTAGREKDDASVPKISKNLTVMKWTVSFKNYLSKKIGVRMIPLSYVIRENVIPVPAAAPTLRANLPYSEDHESVRDELVDRATHTHAKYQDDNATVFDALEEATRGTMYASAITNYNRSKNGREAWNTILAQYAGEDRWVKMWEQNEKLLNPENNKWKGQNNYSLDAHCRSQRNAFIAMKEAAQNLSNKQLPNETTRVEKLIKSIECGDAALQARIASIENDKGEEGMAHDFEAAVAYLLPADPVSKKRVEKKRPVGEAAGVDGSGADVGSTSTKPRVGRTGVEFRYYKNPEFKALTKEQRDELIEWRNKNPKSKSGTSQSSKRQKASDTKMEKIAIAAAEKVAEEMQKVQAAAVEKQAADLQAHFQSMIDSAKGNKNKASAGASVAITDPKDGVLALQSILSRNSKYGKSG